MPSHHDELVIQPATVADVPALSELLTILFTQESEFVTDAAAQSRGLLQILALPQVGEILVACKAGKVVGMVGVLFTISTALGATVGLLEDLVVLPEYRGHGVGSRLLSTAIEAAKQRGCRRVTLLTDAANVGAQRLYQQHGFVKSGMTTMRLLLAN